MSEPAASEPATTSSPNRTAPAAAPRRSAAATLDWLDAHGHQELVRNAVAVVNAVRPRSGKVDLRKVVDHFGRRCRAVQLVPFDPHLEEGAEISLDRLRPDTRDALLELAVAVADGFPLSL